MLDYVYWIALFVAIILTSVSNVMIKMGAKTSGAELNVRIFLNHYILTGLSMFVLVTLLTTFAARILPLRTIVAWTAATYVLTQFAARLFLKEPLKRDNYLGVLLIMMGLIIYSLGS